MLFCERKSDKLCYLFLTKYSNRQQRILRFILLLNKFYCI
uniref:Uncharacterized protein n=1 Tax=Arundo donax TaxID=35708 RepID=A0A0A9BI82_ARUDO